MRHFSIPAFALVFSLLATVSSPLGGQVAPSIEPGSRVRITAPSSAMRGAVGTVQEATEEALVVQFAHRRVVGQALCSICTVDRSEIAVIDVSIRRERRLLKSFGIGLLVGAPIGTVIGLAHGAGPYYRGQAMYGRTGTVQESAASYGTVLGLIGGAVGLIAGVLIRHDVWAPALPTDVEPTLLPLVSSGGAGLHVGLAIRFN